MQMNLFDTFDVNAKACIAWSTGVHIGYRSQGSFYMSLYRLNNFYVEVQYHTGYDGIASVCSFTEDEKLEPYLNQISLEEILTS